MDTPPTAAIPQTPPPPPPHVPPPPAHVLGPPHLFTHYPGSIPIQGLFGGVSPASAPHPAPLFFPGPFPWARPGADRAPHHPYMMPPYPAPMPMYHTGPMYTHPHAGAVFIAAEAERRKLETNRSMERLTNLKAVSDSPDEDPFPSYCESEGSYETREDSTYQQRKKNSVGTSKEDGTKHNAASIQHTSSSESLHEAKHPVFEMQRTVSDNHAIDLNVGMGLPNVSHVNLKVRHDDVNFMMPMDNTAVVGREGPLLGHSQRPDNRELRKERRKQSNRESARRSRLRKMQECDDLTRRVDELSDETVALRSELQQINKDCEDLESQNDSIEVELVNCFGPGILSVLEGITGCNDGNV